MTNNKSIKYIVSIIVCFIACSTQQVTIKKQVEFSYKIENVNYRDSTYIFKNDTLKFYFCVDGVACDYKYRFNQILDTLEIIQDCDPATKKQHEVSFCVSCKISGLKTGTYYIKSNGSLKNVEIK
jgi:hypothetical protein